MSIIDLTELTEAEHVLPVEDHVMAEPSVIRTKTPLQACKSTAVRLLKDTDWTQLSDAATSLANKADFDAYRAAVRAILCAPVEQPVFPEKPVAIVEEEQWDF